MSVPGGGGGRGDFNFLFPDVSTGVENKPILKGLK